MLDDTHTEDEHNLLASLIEQARATATSMAGNPERDTTCHFCSSNVPLWESLLVMQLTGVPSHLRCPEDTLAAKLRESGPVQEFPYDDFSSAVDARLEGERPVASAGEITLK